jgi:hypothetical protein
MYVRIEGADSTLRALRQMEPQTAKEVGREITSVGRMIAGRASAPGIALRNWRTSAASRSYRGSRQGSGGWPAYEIGGVSVKRRGMDVTLGHFGAAGAIYESAGIRTQGRDARGRAFISYLPPLPRMSSKRSGRYLRRALAAVYPQAIRDIEKAANKAADAVNRLMG